MGGSTSSGTEDRTPASEGDGPGGNGGFQDVYRYPTDGGRTFAKQIRVTERNDGV